MAVTAPMPRAVQRREQREITALEVNALREACRAFADRIDESKDRRVTGDPIALLYRDVCRDIEHRLGGAKKVVIE